MPRKPKRTADDYTREELYARAERKGIKYRSRMNKQQLFKALGLGRAGKKKAAPAKKKAAKARPAARKPAAGKKKAAPAKKKAAKARPAARGKTRKAARAAEPAAPRPTPVTSAEAVVPPPPPAPPAAAYIDRGPELPAGYGEDRIVALVRDPRCIFVYWELGGGARASADEGALAGGVWVLRLVQVRGDRFFDVPIDPATGNWYLHVEPGERYQVKIGLALPSGAFHELCASGEVLTPTETVSEAVDQEWMLVREEFDRLVEQILSARGPGGGAGSSEVLHRLQMLPRRMRLFSGALSSPRGGGR